MEIKHRVVEIEAEITKLKEIQNSFVEEGKILQQKLNEVGKQIIEKSGAYVELKKLSEEPKKKAKEPSKELAKKPKKKSDKNK